MPVNIRFNGDASNLQDEQQSVEDGAKKIRDEYKKLIQDAKPVERETKKIWEESRTPLEKYNERVKQLATLLKTGRITQEQYTTALTRFRQELDDANTARIRAFGSEALNQLKGFALQLGVVVGAAEAVRNVLAEVAEERREAVGQTGDFARGIAPLAQISDNAEQFSRMVQDARALFASGVGARFEEAAALVESVESSGLGEALQLFGRIERTGIAGGEIQEFIKSTKQLQSAFQGTAGTAADIVSKAFAANTISIDTAASIAAGTAQVGTFSQELGFSDEETMAAIALLADTKGSARVAGDRLRAFFSKAIQQGIPAGSIEELVRTVETRRTAGETFKDILGSEDLEAVEGFRLLRNRLADLPSAIETIRTGERDQAVFERLGLVEQNEFARAALARQQALNINQLSQQLIGTQAAIEEGISTLADAANTAAGAGRLRRGLSRTIEEFEREQLGLQGVAVREALQPGRLENELRAARERGDQFGVQTIQLMQQQVELLREIRSQGQQLPPLPSIPAPEAN